MTSEDIGRDQEEGEQYPQEILDKADDGATTPGEEEQVLVGGMSRRNKRIFLITTIVLILVGTIIGVVVHFATNKSTTNTGQKQCAELVPDGFDNPLVGDGFCNGGPFMTEACGNDGGDCDKCVIPPSSEVSTGAIVAVDVNNDGYVDLIIGNYGEPNQLLLNNGAAGNGTTTSFLAPIDLPGGSMQTTVIVAADMNNDGLVDLLIGNAGSVNSPEPNLLVLNNGAAGTSFFQAPINLPGDPMYTHAIVAVDANHDGIVDLIIGNYDEPNQLIINQSAAGGNANTNDETIGGTPTPPSFDVPIDLPGDDMYTHAIVAADINSDGEIDLIFGNYAESNQFFLNNGIATDDPTDLPGGDSKYTRVIAAADVNNDGHVDLIIGNYRGSSNQLLLNTGTAGGTNGGTNGNNNGGNNTGGGEGWSSTTSFPEVIDLPGGLMWTRDIVAADVNGDGWVDLIIGNYKGPNQLLLNTGTRGTSGTGMMFQSAIDFPCSDDGDDGGDDGDDDIGIDIDIDVDMMVQTNSISVADMNNDGHPDIVFGNANHKNQLLINLGDGISYREPAGTDSSWL